MNVFIFQKIKMFLIMNFDKTLLDSKLSQNYSKMIIKKKLLDKFSLQKKQFMVHSY